MYKSMIVFLILIFTGCYCDENRDIQRKPDTIIDHSSIIDQETDNTKDNVIGQDIVFNETIYLQMKKEVMGKLRIGDLEEDVIDALKPLEYYEWPVVLIRGAVVMGRDEYAIYHSPDLIKNREYLVVEWDWDESEAERKLKRFALGQMENTVVDFWEEIREILKEQLDKGSEIEANKRLGIELKSGAKESDVLSILIDKDICGPTQSHPVIYGGGLYSYTKKYPNNHNNELLILYKATIKGSAIEQCALFNKYDPNIPDNIWKEYKLKKQDSIKWLFKNYSIIPVIQE